MFGNRFCFLFSKTCFWEYKEKTIFLYFLFSVYFGLPNKFFNLKNRKLFLKTEKKVKKKLPNIP